MQTHDFNAGFGPEVSPVGSNGFGTRTFWTVAIPDSDVTIIHGQRLAEMRVDNLSIPDFGTKKNSFGPNFATAFDPGVVSFDVVWSNPITRAVHVTNGTLGNHFAGFYAESQVTVTWSGTNLATGFSFTSNPGTLGTSFFDGGFAEQGFESNGFFVDSAGSRAAAALVQASTVLSSHSGLPAAPPIAVGPGSPSGALGHALGPVAHHAGQPSTSGHASNGVHHNSAVKLHAVGPSLEAAAITALFTEIGHSGGSLLFS